MSVEERLRSGLSSEAGLVSPLTEEQLTQVGRRHRRRRATRWSAWAAAAVAATVVGVSVVPGQLPGGGSEAPPAAVEQTSLNGEYVVRVAPGSAAQREGMVGRWTVSVTEGGVLEIEPPTTYGRAVSGASYEIDGDLLTTNALLDHPGCQSATNGEYRWTLSDSTLELAVVDDRCPARRLLFSGQSWRRDP